MLLNVMTQSGHNTHNLFIEFIHEVRDATQLPIERTWEVFAVC